ncbi:MAG: hypothetical protein JSU04_08535 [Bdellovibrionales bacterium]|nr:hypothetical protein [Bdellovibrionales bacterium]
MKLLSALLFSQLVCVSALAMDMRTDLSKTKSFLTASGEAAQFTLDEGQIAGSGLKVDFTNSFSDKIALEVYLASAINTAGGASFTGIGGYTYYNVLGECCATVRTVAVDGKPMVTETSLRGQNLQIGLGLDQYFLNGSKSVYSASGLGLSVVYQFPLFNYNFKTEARHSQMTAGQNKIQGNFFSFGVVFAL